MPPLPPAPLSVSITILKFKSNQTGLLKLKAIDTILFINAYSYDLLVLFAPEKVLSDLYIYRWDLIYSFWMRISQCLNAI